MGVARRFSRLALIRSPSFPISRTLIPKSYTVRGIIAPAWGLDRRLHVCYNNCIMQTKSDRSDGTLMNELRRNIRLLQREVARRLQDDTICCGVTLAQCHALCEIPDSGISLKDLAGTLDLDASTLSRTVEGLVRTGLLDRTVDPADRRAVRLTLSPAGKERVDSINDTGNRFYAGLLAEMSPEDRSSVVRAVSLLVGLIRRFRTEPFPSSSCCCASTTSKPTDCVSTVRSEFNGEGQNDE